MRWLAVAGVLCGVVAGAPSAVAQAWGVRADGVPLATLAPASDRAVALFFVASDCPISNREFPEMKRLREEFAGQGVQVWFVYPNTAEQHAAVLQHQREFDGGGDVLFDPAGSLVRLAHAVATPEIAVLTPDARSGWRPVYTGRIDNRYVRLGLERPAPTEFFGEAALRDVLAGRPPKPSVGAPVGCAIISPGVR